MELSESRAVEKLCGWCVFVCSEVESRSTVFEVRGRTAPDRVHGKTATSAEAFPSASEGDRFVA